MNRKTAKAIAIIDGICVLLFIWMILYIFALPDHLQDILLPVFTIINPYRTGSWIMGFGFLITCIWGKGKKGLWLGIVMLVCYAIMAFISLFGLITLTRSWELLWYLHPVLLVIGITIAIKNGVKKRAG